jgi:hypothetical protein
MDMISSGLSTNDNPNMPSSTTSMASLVNTDSSAPMGRNQTPLSPPVADTGASLNDIINQLLSGGL